MTPEDWLKQLKAEYPKRAPGKGYGWPEAFQQIQKRFKEGHTFEDILEGTKKYCAATKISGDHGTPFVKQASTFYGPGLHFLDEFEVGEEITMRYRRPQEPTEAEKRADLDKFEEQMRKFGVDVKQE